MVHLKITTFTEDCAPLPCARRIPSVERNVVHLRLSYRERQGCVSYKQSTAGHRTCLLRCWPPSPCASNLPIKQKERGATERDLLQREAEFSALVTVKSTRGPCTAMRTNSRLKEPQHPALQAQGQGWSSPSKQTARNQEHISFQPL